MKQQGEGKGTGPREAVSGVGLPREDGEVGQGEEGRKDSLLLTPPPRKQLPGLQVHRPVRGFCSSDGSVGRRGREMGWP